MLLELNQTIESLQRIVAEFEQHLEERVFTLCLQFVLVYLRQLLNCQ